MIALLASNLTQKEELAQHWHQLRALWFNLARDSPVHSGEFYTKAGSYDFWQTPSS